MARTRRGVASRETFGQEASVSFGQLIVPAGIPAPSPGAGEPTIFNVRQDLVGIGGIASAQAIGAHAVLPQPVIISPPGIASAQAFGPGVGVGLDFPTSLALTGFWRNYAGTAPLLGKSTLGVSGDGSHDLIATTSGGSPVNVPGNGPALNGWGTINFDGSKVLQMEGLIPNYFDVNGSNQAQPFSGWVLCRPSTVTRATAQRIISEGNNDQFTIDLPGDSTVRFSTNVGASTCTRACSANAWQYITWRFTGTQIQIGVNEVPGAAGGGSITADSLITMSKIGDGNGVFFLGAVTAGAPQRTFEGLVAEVGLANFALNDTQFTSVKAYINFRYNLAL